MEFGANNGGGRGKKSEYARTARRHETTFYLLFTVDRTKAGAVSFFLAVIVACGNECPMLLCNVFMVFNGNRYASLQSRPNNIFMIASLECLPTKCATGNKYLHENLCKKMCSSFHWCLQLHLCLWVERLRLFFYIFRQSGVQFFVQILVRETSLSLPINAIISKSIHIFSIFAYALVFFSICGKHKNHNTYKNVLNQLHMLRET